MGKRYLHKSVLLKEALYYLDPGPGKIIVDATVGAGGHAAEILKLISHGGFLIGIDRDEASLRIADRTLRETGGEFKLIKDNFRSIKNILRDMGTEEIDGILFDLGISSMQLEDGERGFSIRHNGPLDMRMDRAARLTASEIVNTYSSDDISFILERFGEERFHRKIARKIAEERRKKRIESTGELAEIVKSAVPAGRRRKKIHPATRTFQAIRIAVNDEIAALEEAINSVPFLIKRGGRMCIISFHSLEDRIAKNAFKEFASQGILKVLTRKPVRPGEREIEENPRARSAKLRAAERIK